MGRQGTPTFSLATPTLKPSLRFSRAGRGHVGLPNGRKLSHMGHPPQTGRRCLRTHESSAVMSSENFIFPFTKKARAHHKEITNIEKHQVVSLPRGNQSEHFRVSHSLSAYFHRHVVTWYISAYTPSSMVFFDYKSGTYVLYVKEI